MTGTATGRAHYGVGHIGFVGTLEIEQNAIYSYTINLWKIYGSMLKM